MIYLYHLLVGILLIAVLDKPLRIALIIALVKELFDLITGGEVNALEFIAIVIIPFIVEHRSLWLVTAMCLALHIPAQAQYEWKSKLPTFGLFFVSGAGDGLAEKLKHHYWEFKAQFPNANDQVWNPNLSWVNKWKVDENGNVIYPLQERYWGSSTVFSGLTDPYHGARTISRSTATVGTVIWIGRKQKWWHYLVDAAAITASRNIGFHTIY